MGIQATQAAVGLTEASIKIGNAIGNLHEQKRALQVGGWKNKIAKWETEAVTNHNFYKDVLDKDGNVVINPETGLPLQEYVGSKDYKPLDPEAEGLTLGEIKAKWAAESETLFWTKEGKETGKQRTLNELDGMELSIQRQLTEKVIKEQQAVVQQRIADFTEAYRKDPDGNNIDDFIKTLGFSAAQGEAIKRDIEREAGALNIADAAEATAVQRGTEAAKRDLDKLLADGKINPDQYATYLDNATRARARSVKPRQETINSEWNGRTADALTPELAESAIRRLQSERSRFEAADNMDAYWTFMSRLQSKAGSGHGGGGGGQSDDDSIAFMDNVRQKYARGEIGIDQAYEEMNGVATSAKTIAKRDEYFKTMLNEKDPLTKRAYDRFDALCKECKVDDRIKSDLQQTLMRTFTNNEIRREDRLKYVEGMINEQIAEYMNKALKPGVSWSKSELEKLNALSYDKKLDPYFEPVGDPVTGVKEMEVSGAGEIKKNVINYSKEKVEDAIKLTGMKYKGHEEEKTGNDKTGRIFHIVEDRDGKEHKVIVNKAGQLETEKLVGGGQGTKQLVLFDRELKAGKEAELKKFEEDLPKDIHEKALGLSQLRDIPYADAMRSLLGLKSNNPITQAYIDMMYKKHNIKR